MKKQNKIYIIATVVATLSLICLFSLDIGINSEFYIKRDFDQAFQYRMTGDCIIFGNYIYQAEGTWIENKDKWIEACENEKNSISIRKFKVTAITHQLWSDTAFLQAELTRNSANKDGDTYAVSYKMKKSGLIWKIANEK